MNCCVYIDKIVAYIKTRVQIIIHLHEVVRCMMIFNLFSGHNLSVTNEVL